MWNGKGETTEYADKAGNKNMLMHDPKLKSVLVFFLMLFGILGIGAGGLSGFIHYRGGLDVLVTDYVSRHYPALSISFSDLKWHVHIAGPVLTLKASDVELSYGEQSIEIPSLDFSFTPASLVTGMPTSIIVDTDRIEIERARSGWQFADHPEWLKIQGSEADQFFISEQLGQFSDFWKFWPSGLRRLQIQSEQLVIKSAEQLWQDISFTNISMSAAPEEGNFARGNIQLTARLSQQVETGQIVPRLFARATANLFSGLTEFQLEASHVQIGELSALITDNRFIEALQPGIVSGQLSGAFDLSAMQMLSGDISFKDGQFTLPSIAQTPAAFHSAELSFEYSPSDNLLLVSKAGISLATGQNFHASGRLTRWNGPTSHISGQILIDDIALADLVKKWPEGQADMLKDFVTNQTSAGRLRTMALQLDGYVDWKEGQLDLSSVNLSGEVSNLRLAYKDEQYLSVVGTVGGQFEVSLGGQGQIETATGSLSLRNGFASVRNYDDTIKIPQIDAMLRYQPEESFLQNLFIDFADKGQILAHAKRSLQQGHYISEINLSWPKLDYQLARHIWPDKFAQKTQNWMDKHIRNGLSENAEISVHISGGTPKPEVTLLEGKIPFSDMTFVLFDDLMEVRALTGQLELADNQLSAQFGSGQTQGLDLEQANVTFAPMLAPEEGRNLDFKAIAQGDVADVLTFLAHPKINRIKDTALKDLSISGQTRFSVSFNAIKPEDKALKLSNIKADATLSEAVVSGLPLEQTLSQAELVVAVEDKQTQISGSGLISDIPADFSFNTDEKQSFNLQLKLNDSELLPDWLARRFNWPVKGSAGARLSISKDEGQSDLRVHIKSDVTDLVLQNETFEWAKLQGETGLVNLQLVFGDGRLKSIEDMDIDTSSLKAKGRVSLDEEGVPSFGLLEDVRFPGTELNSILFERSQDARIKFTAEGKTLNLQPLRRDSTLKKGQNIAFDVTADRIVIGPKISFSGALTGATQPDGNGTAALQGSLYVASEPLITESSLDVRFGPSGEYLLGTGLIGGAEVSLNYGPDDTGQLKLELSAQNGGRVLMGLGITDAIRQGQLTMTSRFDDDSFERYRTEFNLEDFVVIEAPAAVRMFSVLSLAGLYGLVEGEGTQFAKGQAVITSQGPIHKLEQVRAAGNAVGLALVGSVNKQTREIDVSGNLVPANQISRLIGQVPLVGQILTGVDKTGLFSTQFSMKGTIEEPDVNVNALALAPGLLRDLFSPDWLGAEGRRILGDEEPQ